MPMRCPGLAQLPPPPAGKTGWPWTAETPALPATAPDGGVWPVLSVVTPSFNQAPYLEETIRSVLLQGYPALEYVVIDGASRDGSADLIRKYEPWLAYWVSEADCGQSHAINRGFERTGGELLAWLNSDDVYEPQALARAAAFRRGHPQVHLLYGAAREIDAQGRQIRVHEPEEFDLAYLVMNSYIAQDAAFFSRAAWTAAGPLNESLHYALDYDLWLRMAARFAVSRIPELLSRRRMAAGTKTVEHPEAFWPEVIDSVTRFYDLPNLPARVLDVRAQALGLHCRRAAAHYMRAGRIAAGRDYLAMALQLTPGLLQQPEEFARVIVNQGRTPELAEINPYVNRIFDNLPPLASCFLPLRNVVRRRIIVLSLAQFHPGRGRTWLLRNLPGLLRDHAWTRQPRVMRILVRLLAPAAHAAVDGD